MSASNWRTVPTPLEEVPVDPDVREKETERIKRKVRWYEGIRPHLRNKSASSTYEKAKRDWNAHIDKRTWRNHGLITRRLEEDYLTARSNLDIGGNNAKESATVGFFERWLNDVFSEQRARKGPEKQADNLLGYITHYMLQQPLMMIEAKRHPKGRDYMTPGELAEVENQVEGYCRQWLKDNPDILFMYAVTCASTEMRFWIMKRSRDMERAKIVGLWEPSERTWAQYRDPGLDCDAEIISAAIDLIKDNPNGSDAAITSASESQSQSDRAPSAVPSKVTGGTSGSRRETPSGNGRGDRSRSRDRRGDRRDDQHSSQEETPEEQSERRRRRERERAKESERRDKEEGKEKEPRRSERGERRERGEREKDRSERRDKDEGKGKGKQPERSERRDKEEDRREQRETSDKSRSLQPSNPIDISRSSSRVDARRPITTDGRRNLAASSSPEYIQMPIRGPRRERGDTERGDRERGGERGDRERGDKVRGERERGDRERGDRERDRGEQAPPRVERRAEPSRSSRTAEPRTRDSLSTVPSTSSDDRNTSSSDNRPLRSRSTKKVVEDPSKNSRRDKPSGSGYIG
ncbi:uncharacterized protein EAF01_008926 [Botrytis porri]|uniref:uncharacterized protein n=1 Tax=Botrytis porri TaxID=87229 RepID=UPI0018FF2871|nr:uncharacterized protein EAF01_008926 [Botrytis porri]KAF7897960.1 hypothetical protein EAF01_008926 [Botrytis porri]